MPKTPWYTLFLDSGIIRTIFEHIRNIFYCSLILAVGLYTHDHPPVILDSPRFAGYWGYPLIGVGIFLFLLNLADSVVLIMKSKFGLAFRLFAALFTIFGTAWLVMVVGLFRVR